MRYKLIFLVLLFNWFKISAQEVIDVELIEWHPNKALVYLPDEYKISKNKYPLIFFFAGKSKQGHNPLLLKTVGIPYWIHKGFKPSAINPIDKKKYKFIVVCPQAYTFGIEPVHLKNVLRQILDRYRVDTTQIYLTGYSAGGWTIVQTLTESIELSQKFAAAVAMSPVSVDKKHEANFKYIAKSKVHTWYIAGTEEGHFLENATRFKDSTNKYAPGYAQLTITNGSHSNKSFQEYFDPNFRREGLNIYEYLLQFKK